MAERPLSLDEELPPRLPVGRGTALLVRGRWRAPGPGPQAVDFLVNGGSHPTIAHGMPSNGSRSAFWGIVPLEPPPRPVTVEVAASFRGGRRMLADAGVIVLERQWVESGGALARLPTPPESAAGPLVAICMATFNPPDELFARQIESIRAQAHRNWVCVISDDGSDPERFAAMERTLGDDRRFAVARSERRLGFYRNFERALALAPSQATHIALADQDDCWLPDKLGTLLSALGGATLVYSDARAVGAAGEVISPSLWRRRRNNRTNLASLLFANTVTGAASLFRRELLEIALPFPPAPGNPYHDHWIALTALAAGELSYVERPLFDYVQHSEAVLGYAGMNPAAANRGWVARLRHRVAERSGTLERWRRIYFDEYCRTLLYARVLRMRCGDRLTRRKRQALDRVLAGERSPLTLGWLAVRPIRALVGRNETRGFEHALLRGVTWRHVARYVSPRSRALRPPAQ
jgi:glycosyltransferase involved in cell wall biosynthesis